MFRRRGVMKRLVILLLVVLLMAVAACTPRGVVAEDPDQQAAPAETPPAAAEPAATQPADQSGAAVIDENVGTTDISRPGSGTTNVAMAGGDRYAAASAAGFPAFTDVHFEFDQYDILAADRENLMKLSTWLMGNQAMVLLEGHCDERGTNEYNLALGDRRSVSVKHFLLASGVPADKIETISYGEEKPVCAQHDETCWAQNRRVHIVLGVLQ
jgi:peptidoglycan-associated lipoprotein